MHVKGAAMAGMLACGVGLSTGAQAIEVPVGDITTIRLENLFTAGAAWRMQERDSSLVSKSTLNPGICVARVQGDFDGDDRMFMGDTCNSTQDDPQFGDANLRYVNERGGYGPNADNGNTNFDEGDLINAAAKLTTDRRDRLRLLRAHALPVRRQLRRLRRDQPRHHAPAAAHAAVQSRAQPPRRELADPGRFRAVRRALHR